MAGRKKQKTHPVGIRFTQEQIDKLDRIAEQLGESRSSIIKRYVRLGLFLDEQGEDRKLYLQDGISLERIALL